jgi:hypothetical protein
MARNAGCAWLDSIEGGHVGEMELTVALFSRKARDILDIGFVLMRASSRACRFKLASGAGDDRIDIAIADADDTLMRARLAAALERHPGLGVVHLLNTDARSTGWHDLPRSQLGSGLAPLLQRIAARAPAAPATAAAQVTHRRVLQLFPSHARRRALAVYDNTMVRARPPHHVEHNGL